MLFSSITFLYYFLPVTLILYYVVPEKGKNLILFLASLFFYVWGEPKYGLLLLFSVGVGYVGGRAIEQADGRGAKAKKLALGMFLTVTAGLLIFFKYTDFILESVNAVAGTDFKGMQIALPIGISFYTFQILSYYVDVYRGTVQAERSFLRFGTYVVMFPQLIAGPIVRFCTVQDELMHRKLTWENVSQGAGRFVCGLCKKVLIADSLGTLVAFLEKMSGTGGETAALKVQGIGTMGYWILAVSFLLQLYYDFSGYSDMAIGLGKMFGFTFPENFYYPFVSKSISEFWRRWHRTLGGWFRDYLYIPLGGSRAGTLKWCRNMFLVWLFSGLWHGAGWNFAIWGLYFGVFLSAEKLIGQRIAGRRKSGGEEILQKAAVFKRVVWNGCRRVYVLLVVLVSFVIFRVENVADIQTQLLGMSGAGHTIMAPLVCYQIKSYAALLVFAGIGATPLVSFLWKKVLEHKIGWLLQGVLIVVGLIAATAFLLGSSVHPFLYFRF